MRNIAVAEAEKIEKVEKRADYLDKRHLMHKRMERWMRLQQFVYGLPDDYAYAIHSKDVGGRCVTKVLVQVGWMSWFGEGKGVDRQHSLAISLLDTTEALSSNSSTVMVHSVMKWFSRFLRRFSGQRHSRPSLASREEESQNLMAG